MDYKLNGRVYYIGEKTMFGNAEKVEVGIARMDNCPYPNLLFEVWGSVIPKLDGMQIGSQVLATFELQGKTYQGKDGNMRSYTVLKITDIEVVPEKGIANFDAGEPVMKASATN
ncbi:MAG: hypothetical protein ACLQQ4_17965 [Bacteroidia bacterium]